MAKQNESTMKFKADIAELKAGLQQAKTAIAQANAEFGRSTEGLDNWRKSSEGVEAKLKQLKSTLAAQNQVLANYRDQLASTEAQYGENSVQAEQLRTKIEQQKSTISKTKSAMNQYEGSLREVSEAERIAEREGISVDEALRKLSGSASDADGAMGDLAQSTENTSGGFTVMKGALASLVADGIKNAIGALKDFALESEVAFDRLHASIGLTTKEFESYKNELEDLYSNNYGESLDDLGQKFAYIKQVTGETDPSKIKELTKNAIALEDTFGSDFNETVRGVQNLMTHFGLSSEEAFDLFAKGSREGLDYTQELGDNVAEYGGNFAQAGYSAEEYFQLLKNGAQGGAYNLDKVNDSINEVKNRIGDGTIKDNLSQFSTGTADLFAKWESGKGSMKDVINSIVGDISNAKSEEEALAMAATAFGTMGEDANLDVVKSLTTLGDTFSDVKGTMTDVDNIRYDNLSSAVDGLGRTLQMAILQPITEKMAPALTNGLNNIIATVKGQMSIGELMSIGADWIKGIGDGLAQGVPNLISKGLTMLVNFTGSIRANAPKLIQAGLGLIQNLVKGLMNSLPELIAKVPTIVSNIANVINDNAPTILKSAVNIVWTIIKGLISAIPSLVANMPKIIKAIADTLLAFGWAKTGKTIITGLKNGITATIGLVKSAASNVKNVVVNAIKNLPKTLGNLAKTAIQKFVAFIRQANGVNDAARKIGTVVVNALKNLPSQILKIGINLVKGLWNGITSVKDWLISKVKGFGKGVLDALKDFFGIHSPSRVMEKEIGKNLALGVANGITKNAKYAKKSASDMASIIVKAAEKRLTSYKANHKITLKEEMNYWKQIVQTTKKGTDGRMAAEKKYLAAQKKYLAENANIKKKAATAEKKYTDSVKKAYEKLNKDITSTLNEYITKLKERTEAITSSMGLFDVFEKNTEQTGDQLIENLKSQVQGLTDWIAALDSLESKGVDTGLLDELRQMGVSAVGQLEALNSLTEKQLAEYVELWKQKNGLANEEATKELAGLQAETVEKIASLVEETKKSLTGYKKTYDDALKDLGLAVKKQVIGTDKTLTTTAAETILKTAPTVGNDMIQGIIDGLNNRSGKLYSTISGIISSAIAAAQAAAEIHSPSKIMRDLIGKNLVRGMIVGVDAEGENLYSTMQDVVKNTLSSAQNVLGKVSEMKSTLSSVGSTLGLYSGSGTISGSQTTNVTFNQTINSPKSLSRVEIYRNTRNLVSQVGGVI